MGNEHVRTVAIESKGNRHNSKLKRENACDEQQQQTQKGVGMKTYICICDHVKTMNQGHMHLHKHKSGSEQRNKIMCI